LKALNSSELADLVARHITNTSEALFLQRKTRFFTCMASLLTLTLSLWGWLAYLPGFFSQYYLSSPSPSLVVFGLAHGLIWILILPLFFGSLFASLLILFTVQELAFLALLESFNRLHPDIERHGLAAVANAGQVLRMNKDGLQQFKTDFEKTWQTYRTFHTQTALPFLVYWLVEFCLNFWSCWSLSMGFGELAEDERLEQLRNYWNLNVRLSWFVGGGLWFGAGGLIVGLLPWGTNYYSWRLHSLSKQLNFAQSDLQSELKDFMARFDLNLKVLWLRASPWTFPIYFIISAFNILGFSADMSRLWSSL
jgi:hypothetical protein